jgi:tRNA (5-methylaminomethyl-2-thiouridylate)-methyltransferase
MMNSGVLISGGVDSSVALSLIKHDGFEPRAFYLKIWLEDEFSYLGQCPFEEDLTYVKETCKQLNVPLEIIPLQKEYWEKVVSYTVEEIKHGHTPNPDIMCNQKVKFGAFLDLYGKDLDFVATGHYAKNDHINNWHYLKTAPDNIKDQTYFLSYTSHNILKKIIFPLGNMTKQDVRKYAETKLLPSAFRKDSQGICFLGKIKFRDFIKHHLGEKEGIIYEYETGKRVATHKGFWFYTVGQRQGIGLSGGPWYIVKKNVHENAIFISKTYQLIEENKKEVFLKSINWLIPEEEKPMNNSEVYIKLRHGPEFNRGLLMYKKDNVHIKLYDVDQGVALGQFGAMYQKNALDYTVLGAGVISEE